MHLRHVFIVIPTLIAEVYFNTQEITVSHNYTSGTYAGRHGSDADHEDGKNEFIFSS
jgi:hypothetical protein